MINNWLVKLRNKFPFIILDKYLIMPNHIHGFFAFIGADLCVCPNKSIQKPKKDGHTAPPLPQRIIVFLLNPLEPSSSNHLAQQCSCRLHDLIACLNPVFHH